LTCYSTATVLISVPMGLKPRQNPFLLSMVQIPTITHYLAYTLSCGALKPIPIDSPYPI